MIEVDGGGYGVTVTPLIRLVTGAPPVPSLEPLGLSYHVTRRGNQQLDRRAPYRPRSRPREARAEAGK